MKKILSLLALSLCAISCKTVSRDDFATKSSVVTIRLPLAYASHEAVAVFSPSQDPNKPRTIKGKNLTINLPAGSYKIDLTLVDANGEQIFQTCDLSRNYSFSLPSEDAILDICKASDSSLAFQTLTQAAYLAQQTPTIQIPTVQPTGPNPVVPTIVPTIDTTMTAVPKFVAESTCFGLNATAVLEGNEVVLRMSESLKDKILDYTSYPKCKVVLNVPKLKEKIYAPLNFKVSYLSDDNTLKQNLFMLADGRDESNNLHLPCGGFLINSPDSSKKPVICSFYDTSAEHALEVFPKTKPQMITSCGSEVSKLVFTLTLAGPNKSFISSLQIPEIRIQLPQTEACPKT